MVYRGFVLFFLLRCFFFLIQIYICVCVSLENCHCSTYQEILSRYANVESRERERERRKVCDRVGVGVCMCVRETERVRERERETMCAEKERDMHGWMLQHKKSRYTEVTQSSSCCRSLRWWEYCTVHECWSVFVCGAYCTSDTFIVCSCFNLNK